MQRSALFLLLLIVCCLALTGFVLREDALRGRDSARSALAVLFGDGRRLFANHFLAKADAYFHRGRYPSIFEMAERERGNHLVESLGEDPVEATHVHGPDCDHHHDDGHVHGSEDDHLAHDGPGEDTPGGHDHGQADLDDHGHEHGHSHQDSKVGNDHSHAADSDQTSDGEHEHDEACAHAEPAVASNDWIARLAKRFEPDRHVHLEEGGEKEMLPWVRLAVEMDPHNVDAYTVGGYWLRQMGRLEEAETFLREGRRNNPESSEIYFELGRLQELEGEGLAGVARLYQLALEKWGKANQGLEEPDILALAQILGRLGKVEEQRGELEAALYYYQLLQKVSPSPETIQQLIDSVRGRLAETEAASQSM